MNPNMDKDKVWDLSENLELLSHHNRVGNKWSAISEKMKGRTDNCIKNHFYALIRKGLRRTNQYLEIHKKKTKVPMKLIKQDQVFKVLSVLESKFSKKYHFNDLAKELALKIKNDIGYLGMHYDS